MREFFERVLKTALGRLKLCLIVCDEEDCPSNRLSRHRSGARLIRSEYIHPWVIQMVIKTKELRKRQFVRICVNRRDEAMQRLRALLN